MSLLDFNLAASNPNDPNSVLSNPADIARRQAIADALAKEGSDYSPIASPWQGAARIADALGGALESRRAQSDQNLGRANMLAELGASQNFDPSTQNIPATPGRSTPALAASDAQVDAQDGAPSSGPAAIAAALGGPSAAPAGVSAPAGPSAVANALGGVAVGQNNNPGNLIDNGWTESLPGFAGAKGRFASFATPEAGISAMQQNLSSYARQGINTIAGLTSKWAPAGDGSNNPAAYAATVAGAIGVGPNDPINLADPTVQAKIVPIMARVEQGASSPTTAQAFTGAPDVAPASAAISAASAAGGPIAHAADGTPVATNAQGQAMDPATGQPAVATTPAPAAPGAPPSPSDVAQLRTAMGAPAPAQPPSGVVAGASAPAGPQPGSVPASPAAAPPPQPQPTGNRQQLLALLADPFTPPALAQVAEQQLAAQTPGRPTWGVVGKDAFGNEQYNWIPNNPNAAPGTPGGAPAGYVAPAAPGAATPGGDSNLHGAAFLATVPPQIAPLVQAVAEGRVSPASLSSRGPMAGPIMRAVTQYDPSFDAGDTESRFATRKNFSSGNIAASITAGNTALQHLKELSDMTEDGSTTHGVPVAGMGVDTNIGDNPVMNGIRNWVGDKFGSNMGDKPYDAIASKFVSEATKLYLGAEGTQGGRDADLATMEPDMSREQLRSVYTANTKAIGSKVAELQAQWKRVMGPTAGEYPLISPETKAAVAAINGRDPNYKQEAQGSAATAGASTGGAPPPPMGIGETQKIGGVTIKRVN
jgi:hypothetical protein